MVIENSGATGGTALADTASNTYTAISPTTLGLGGTVLLTTYYAFNVTALVAGNTISYTHRNSANPAVASALYATGIQTSSSPLDGAVTANATGSSAAPSVTSGTPAQSGELFIGGVFSNVACAATFTQAAGFTTPPNEVCDSGPPATRNNGGYAIHAGTGTGSYGPTISTSAAWNAFIYGFKHK